MADHRSTKFNTGDAQDDTNDTIISSILDTASDKDARNLIEIPLPSIAAHSRPYLYHNGLASPENHSSPSDSPTSSQSTNILTRDSLINEPRLEPKLSLNPRHTKLQASISGLESQIAEMEAKLSKTLDALRSAPTIQQSHGQDRLSDEVMLEQARTIVTTHIKLLHKYNEIKDVGLGLMGLIAEKEGKRLGEVMEERGVDNKD